MKRCVGVILVALSLGYFWGCFHPDTRGGILHFEKGRAVTGSGSFQLGPLPEGWARPRLKKKQLVFENRKIDGTIVVDALCGPKFDDAPLPMLAKNLFYQLDALELKPARRFALDRREAYAQEGTGKIDGVPIEMEVVVFKKNRCLYDLIYFAPPAQYPLGRDDFKEFVRDLRAP